MPDHPGCFIRHPRGLPAICRERAPRDPSFAPAAAPPATGVCLESDRWIEPGTLLDVDIPASQACWSYRALVLAAEAYDGHCELLLGFPDEHEAFHARMVEQLCHIEAYRRELERRDGAPVPVERAAREWIAKHAGTFPAL